MTTPPQQQPYVHIPDAVSQQAQPFLRTLQDPALIPAFPEADNLAGWEKVRAFAEADGKAKSAPLLQRYEHSVIEGKLGGIPVLDVRPNDWKDNGKVAVYTHGGAHVMYSAASSLGRAVVFAHATGLRVISVDYTVAPLAKYNQMSDEVITAISALLKDGQRLADTAIYGDSSGGGLAAAVVLKMRDQGLGMPAAAVLVSPWLDVAPSGGTETTLHDADPNQLYEKHGKQAAAAFANPGDQKDPYASPVYGDYSKGFPPTLIQGGLKETLLSGFVRLYQALDVAGVPVKLDLYEGMIHNFQDRIPDAPEAIVARQKIRAFLYTVLGPMRKGKHMAGSYQSAATGPWDSALEQLRAWDPGWAETCVKMSTNPWTSGVLRRKFVELVGVALNAACTNLNPDGTRRHIRAALEAGATRDEILMVLKCASVMSIHSCSLGAPIFLEEAKAAGVSPAPRVTKAATPACDKMKAVGQWNEGWEPFYELDPVWTEEFMATGIGIYASGVLPPKDVELLSIAFDASYTHMYAPGTRRHIKAALKLGATMEEIMEVLKLCVVQGVQACNLGVPILAEELARYENKAAQP